MGVERKINMPDDSMPAPVAGASGTPSLPTVAPISDAPAAPGPVVDAGVPEASSQVAGAGVPEASSQVAGAGTPGVPSPVVAPTVPTDAPAANAPTEPDPAIPAEVAKKIGEAHNILIALSVDPSVDEMAAAIGLSIYLDKLGKRATAIYSGQTPNALEFLKPGETFENSADTLQDFVIALNKEKADHLRYKLDGDYVKIYITPYKSRIGEEDLEFSYGDYNVDLVLALDVANGVDLDAALREHGRIMHDAVIIDITTGNPGKLGEIEWSDKTASSVSEMIAKLLYSVNSKEKIEKEEATAFLTGIVAATNRFANAHTTSETMRISSRLIDSGANQQLISKNITPDIDNEMLSMGGMGSLGTIDDSASVNGDPTLLDIEHGNEKGVDETKEVDGIVTEKESTLLDDLKAAEASLASAGAEVTDTEANEPLKIDSADSAVLEAPASPAVTSIPEEPLRPETPAISGESSDPGESASSNAGEDAENTINPGLDNTPAADGAAIDAGLGADSASVTTGEGNGSPVLPEVKIDDSVKDTEAADEDAMLSQPEKIIQPSSDFEEKLDSPEENKYGQMLENALASANGVAVEPMAPVASSDMSGTAPVGAVDTISQTNPAAMGAPDVPVNPEINGVPEINYMPMPGDAVLPPPPTPPIADAGSVPPVDNAEAMAAPADSVVAPTTEPAPGPLGAQPAVQDQASNAPANDPGAFKIPGM